MSSSTNLLTYAVVIVQHINKFWTGWGGGGTGRGEAQGGGRGEERWILVIFPNWLQYLTWTIKSWTTTKQWNQTNRSIYEPCPI